MQYELRDYQIDAVTNLLAGLVDSLSTHKRRGKREALLLSAVTAAGKTVMAAALLEAALLGKTRDYGVDDEGLLEGATFLWLSQDPALNRQTAARIEAASGLISEERLRIIDRGVDEAEFEPGKVYFLNTDKLGTSTTYTESGTDRRNTSLWDTIKATSERKTGPLILLIDEAHLGVGEASVSKGASTIMARLIADAAGTPPVVLAITATPDRFKKANPRTLGEEHVIPVDVVRESGVIKQRTVMADVGESGTFAATVLGVATRKLAELDGAWATYADDNDLKRIHPLMVVQVQDSVSDAHLFELVSIMREAWPELGADSFCHTLEDHKDRVQGPVTIHYTPPERIAARTQFRVAITKKALTTGWDCPRAEVLYSERPVQDATLIAQTVGRLLRAPLVHRIDDPDLLNEVYAYLPSYHAATASAVVAHLNGLDAPDPDDEIIREVSSFGKDAGKGELLKLVASLPSLSTPARHIDPMAAAFGVAAELGHHGIDRGALERLTKRLLARMVGLKAEHAAAIAEQRDDLMHVDFRFQGITPGSNDVTQATERVRTSDADLYRAWQQAVKQVPQEFARTYFKHITDPLEDAGAEYDTVEVRADITALIRTEGIVQALVDTASDALAEMFNQHDVAIAAAGAEARTRFAEFRAQSGKPELRPVTLPETMRAVTAVIRGEETTRVPLTTGHLYVDDAGQFPIPQGSSWEAHVISTEQSRPGFAGWYRNPPGGGASISVPYEKAEGWTAVHPDFIILQSTGDGLAASIVDPHDPSRDDAIAKLKALSDYAAQYGDVYLRIESVAKVGGEYRKLSLKDAAVRTAVANAGTEQGAAAALFATAASKPYL